MGIAVHPLGNWDQKTKRYLFFSVLFTLIHSPTGWLRMGLQTMLPH